MPAPPRTLSTRDRKVSVISTAPRYIESYFEGNDLIQIYEEEHVDESGAVTRVRGIMDNNGTVLVPAAFAYISPLNPNRYVVRTTEGKWGLINRQNERMYPLEADHMDYIAQSGNQDAGVILVQKDNRWTIVNLDGKTVGDTIWDGLAFYDDHSIMALSGEQMYLVNYLGEITVELPVVPVACGNYFDGAYVLVHRYSKNGETFGIQDKDGNMILPADYHSVNFLTPHLIIAAQWSPANRAFKDKAYLFDEKGNLLTDRNYNDIHSIPNKQGEHKLLIAKHYELEDNGTYNPRHYLLDANGNKILSDDFDSYAILEEKEQVVLYQNRHSTTVDLNGNLISPSNNQGR